MILLYVIIGIIIFGVLIAVHEFGHFAAAKSLGVQVNEFSIGMGPQVWSHQGKETLYSLRCLPIGGYCAMEGEDEATANPRSFAGQKAWKRLIILLAGALMNFIFGVLILICLYAGATAFYAPVIDGFMDGFPLQGEEGLLPGDRIVSIDGHRILVYTDVSIYFSRSNGETMDLVIERNGEKLLLDDFPLHLDTYEYEGETAQRYGLLFSAVPAGPGDRVREALFMSVDFLRLTKMGLGDLFTGGAGLQDLSGPVGVVQVIGEVGSQSATARDAWMNILFITALIAANLAFMNLLPIPALDGGRILFLIIDLIIMLIARRRIDPKYEAYIHYVGMVCLLGLMVIVTFSDVWKLFQ